MARGKTSDNSIAYKATLIVRQVAVIIISCTRNKPHKRIVKQFAKRPDTAKPNYVVRRPTAKAKEWSHLILGRQLRLPIHTFDRNCGG